MNPQLATQLREVSLLREQQKYQDSIALAQELLQTLDLPEYATVHLHLNISIALRLLKEYDKAQQEAQLAKLKNSDPNNNHFILFELASVLESAGNFQDASKFYLDASTSPIEEKDSIGLRERYLEHAHWCQGCSGDPAGLNLIQKDIQALESKLQLPDIAKETGNYDRKYNLQVWLSKAYMHAWELGDKTVSQKLDALFVTNPLLQIRKKQWEELKNKANAN